MHDEQKIVPLVGLGLMMSILQLKPTRKTSCHSITPWELGDADKILLEQCHVALLTFFSFPSIAEELDLSRTQLVNSFQNHKSVEVSFTLLPFYIHVYFVLTIFSKFKGFKITWLMVLIIVNMILYATSKSLLYYIQLHNNVQEIYNSIDTVKFIFKKIHFIILTIIFIIY